MYDFWWQFAQGHPLLKFQIAFSFHFHPNIISSIILQTAICMFVEPLGSVAVAVVILIQHNITYPEWVWLNYPIHRDIERVCSNTFNINSHGFVYIRPVNVNIIYHKIYYTVTTRFNFYSMEAHESCLNCWKIWINDIQINEIASPRF